MNLGDLKHTIKVLKQETGAKFPVILLKSFLKGKNMYKNSPYNNSSRLKQEYAKRLSKAAGIYGTLQEEMSEAQAFLVMRRIMVPMAVKQMQRDLEKLDLPEKGMQRFYNFWDYLNEHNISLLHDAHAVERNEKYLKFRVDDCFFARFCKKAGAPELARFFCEADHVFFPRNFPKVEFIRLEDEKDTIAYGKDKCITVFKERD